MKTVIDTVVLYLERDEFVIQQPDRFSPSARRLITPPYESLGASAYLKCTLNPSKKATIYSPRLTLTLRYQNGSYSLRLRVEFSAPKLLFGNNFDELTDSDFPELIETLRKRLKELGVLVFGEILRKASVSSIHFSKNIVFTNYLTVSMSLKDLSRIDLSKRLDIGKTDFRNDGHAVRYHCNNFELAFYDKVKDLQQAKISEKRAIEKQNHYQLNLFDDWEKAKQPKPEVLRMEVRIGNRQKLKSIFKKMGKPQTIAFEALFSSKLSQEVLLYYWEHIEAVSRFMPVIKAPQEEFINALALNHPELRANKRLQLIGAKMLLEAFSVREVRDRLGLDSTQWSRIKKDLEAVSFSLPSSYNELTIVRDALRHFTPVKLSQYKDLMTSCR